MSDHDEVVFMQAAHALHNAQAWPVPSAEYVAAEKALDELLARVGGWDAMKRDDRRLAKRYFAAKAAHKPDIVAHARSLGLLPNNTD